MKEQWMAGLLLVAALLAASAAHAGDVNDIGPTVRRQVERQASGRQVVAIRPIPKDVADRRPELGTPRSIYSYGENF